MIQSGWGNGLTPTDACCGTCIVVLAVGESEWCVLSNDCDEGCACAAFTADCFFPEAETETPNDGPDDIQYVVLCTPCADQEFGTQELCGNACDGECTVKLVGDETTCSFCKIDSTCSFGTGPGTPPPDSICDCDVDCTTGNGGDCGLVGTTFVTACDVKTAPSVPCPDCSGLGGS